MGLVGGQEFILDCSRALRCALLFMVAWNDARKLSARLQAVIARKLVHDSHNHQHHVVV